METFEGTSKQENKKTKKITQSTSKNLGTAMTEYQENSLEFFGPGNERRGGHIEHTDGGMFIRGRPKS